MLTAHMLGVSSQKGIPSWFLVHRKELLQQSARAFDDVGIHFGIIAADYQHDHRPLVQLGSIQTLARRLNKVKTPKLIVWDEVHHIASASWSKIHANYPDAIHIGLTATPQRLDGKGLGDWFSHMVKGPSVTELIEQGYLSPYTAYAPMTIKADSLHTRMGDYVTSEMESLMDKPIITGDVVRHYQKYASGKRAIIFCASIKHSVHVVEQFRVSGIPAEHVDGETDKTTRYEAMKRFRNGKTLVISNVELFGEGLDVPGMEAVILLRPTQSLGLCLQQVGRVLRPAEGKTAIILDHVGNLERHGLPDDDREWSLAGRGEVKAGKNDIKIPVRTCPVCFAVVRAAMNQCSCGHVFEVQYREVKEQEGELIEIDKAMFKRQQKVEQGRAKSLDDLIALGKARGYKNPRQWAFYVYNARMAKGRG